MRRLDLVWEGEQAPCAGMLAAAAGIFPAMLVDGVRTQGAPGPCRAAGVVGSYPCFQAKTDWVQKRGDRKENGFVRLTLTFKLPLFLVCGALVKSGKHRLSIAVSNEIVNKRKFAEPDRLSRQCISSEGICQICRYSTAAQGGAKCRPSPGKHGRSCLGAPVASKVSKAKS